MEISSLVNFKNLSDFPKGQEFETLYFPEIWKTVQEFSSLLLMEQEAIAQVLIKYETYNVILDEIKRSVDVLDNLHKNREFFVARVGGIKAYLPKNQPLYALICFGVIPALMAESVSVRPPEAAHGIFKDLVCALNLKNFFPNLEIFCGDKAKFSKMKRLETSAVIFTGQSEVGLNIRKLYPEGTLFILNGSGHNPIVVSETADVAAAVQSTLRVSLQNQGQDCSAPSAILVHEKKLSEFRALLCAELDKIDKRVGPYCERDNIVGPNTDAKRVLKTAAYLYENRRFFLRGGNVNPVTKIIQPTVIEKPLSCGPVFEEFFAPLMVLQSYSADGDLKAYFEHPRYFQNAMYVTIFGQSEYVDSLIAKGLHTSDNILYDTDLHEKERGFLQYGGLGPRASCVFYGSRKIAGATLPQREIFKYLVEPRLSKNIGGLS